MAAASSIEEIREETARSIEGYVLSLKIYGSFKRWLEARGFPVFVERDLPRKVGTPKRPDLLVKTPSKCILIDHKYVTSSDPTTLRKTLEDMEEYDTEFQVDDSVFHPDVAMLCPQEAAQHLRGLQPPPTCIIWGYQVEKEITIEPTQGQVTDPSLARLFTPSVTFEVADETLRYKFLRQEPPVPYTAESVYGILWHLRREWTPSQFTIPYNVVLRQFNTLYPPWISRDVQQLTPGRLNRALTLLDKLGFVAWDPETKDIVVDVKRGRRLPDLLGYLIAKHAEMEAKRRRVRRAGRPPVVKPPSARIRPKITLDRWQGT